MQARAPGEHDEIVVAPGRSLHAGGVANGDHRAARHRDLASFPSWWKPIHWPFGEKNG